MATRSPLPKSSALQFSQLRELSQREIVSAIVGFPAILTVAWVHRSVAPLTHSLGWVSFLFVILLVRIGMARKILVAEMSGRVITRWRQFRIALSCLYGAGWGSMMFLLDSGQADFLFMFKYATLAAVLGITVNAFSVVLPVYLCFLGPLVLMVIVSLSTVPYLHHEARLVLIFGFMIYPTVLVVAAINMAGLTRQALKQRFEREAALDAARASQQREVLLRELLQTEAAKLEDTNRSLQAANARLNDLAHHDELTGAFNRRHLMDELEHQLQLRRRHATEFSIAILDIDRFKAINDTYGHQVGDLVLNGLARLLDRDLRDIDVFGRWGGEEFLCILPNTSLPEALSFAERLRTELEKARLVDAHPDLVVTASFGVSNCLAGEAINTLIKRADAALYQAKAAGRNRVIG